MSGSQDARSTSSEAKLLNYNSMFVDVKKADYGLYAHFIISLPLTYKRAANATLLFLHYAPHPIPLPVNGARELCEVRAEGV